jgi:uncharacterized protein
MQISPGITIINTALFIEKERSLIINDLHLGYEQVLHHKGILVPRHQLNEIIHLTEDIIQKTKPKTIIINGDLKHEFGKILAREWREVLQFLDFLSQHVERIIIIAGNHDTIIKPIAEKRGIEVKKQFLIGENLIVHGDEIIETKAKRVIIGHEHPAITIRKNSKYEKYKCFLKGKFKRTELIAVPSFNPLLEGTDILEEQTLSPYLNKLGNFEVYIVSKGEIFDFGKVKDITLTEQK